jgi:hypothetical protein
MYDSDVSLDIPLHGFVPTLGIIIDRPFAAIGTVIEGLHVPLFVDLVHNIGRIAGGVLHEGNG